MLKVDPLSQKLNKTPPDVNGTIATKNSGQRLTSLAERSQATNFPHPRWANEASLSRPRIYRTHHGPTLTRTTEGTTTTNYITHQRVHPKNFITMTNITQRKHLTRKQSTNVDHDTKDSTRRTDQTSDAHQALNTDYGTRFTVPMDR